MADLFPALDSDHILDRVRKVWDVDSTLPMPKVTLSCPVCGEGEWQVRFWRFFERGSGGHPYRCDVSLKCTVCSVVQLFGIPVPQQTFDAQHERSAPIHWRDARLQVMTGESTQQGRWQTVEVADG